MRAYAQQLTEQIKVRSFASWSIFFVLVYAVLIVKLVTIANLADNVLFAAYSILVSLYILSRFAIAYFYDPQETSFDYSYIPSITFGIPSKNEETNIRETIMRIVDSDYPKDKFDVVAINDGSTDNTLQEMRMAKKLAEEKGVRVEVVNWKTNKGKREGMAESVRRSDKDLVVFIDSDSFIEKETARELAKYFINPNVSAVAAHGYVANENINALTKMQAVRYYVAFKAYKSAEALFGSVTCCSGCCSAYRRSHVNEVLDEWVSQYFLGVKCTYGDDRALTNMLLEKGYETLYAPEAAVRTFVPETFKQFMKQQLRWKKSWVRESFKAAKFLWKKHPIMSVSFYLGLILPLVAPIVVFRALVWYPIALGTGPWFYLFGLVLMAAIYAVYYYIHTKDDKWAYGLLFSVLYTLILVWQLPYAIVNLRDARWGTR